MVVHEATLPLLANQTGLTKQSEVTRDPDGALVLAESEQCRNHVMQVGELGDFSVSYRVAGLLPDVSRLIGTRSRLRCSS